MSFIDSISNDGSSGWKYALPFHIKPRDMPLRDISHLAVWTLSSCKNGYGINELLNDNVEKYWQSDGPQPHVINIEFQKKTDISFIMLYLDYKNDESYTPSKVLAKIGHSTQDWFYRVTKDLTEPQGWLFFDMRDRQHNPQRAWVIQLQVLHNHQNGRDTHIRHVRVIGPSRSRFCPEARLLAGDPALSYTFPAKVNEETSKSVDHFFTSMTLR